MAQPDLLNSLSPAARITFDALQTSCRTWCDPFNPTLRFKPVALYDSALETEEGEPNIAVPYQQFRSALAPCELAMLYEVSYRDLRRELDVPVIDESSVQGLWRRIDRVPPMVMNYLTLVKPRLAKMVQSRQIDWNVNLDQRMLQLLMDGESFLEVAFLMTTEFNQCFTVGTLKGRRYNTLAGMSKAALQHHGLPQHQIDYLQPQRASQRSVAAAHQVAWTIPKRS